MTSEIVFAIIGAVVGIAGMVFGLVTQLRNKKAEDKADGKEGGVLLTEVGYIKSGVDDIKRHQEKQDELYIAVIQRLTAVEGDTKRAHKRIDKLEGFHLPNV